MDKHDEGNSFFSDNTIAGVIVQTTNTNDRRCVFWNQLDEQLRKCVKLGKSLPFPSFSPELFSVVEHF
jgi:hypothetical protein